MVHPNLNVLDSVSMGITGSGELLKIFFLTLFFWLRHVMPPPPPLWHPPGAITPEKVIRHHRKAQGRFGGTGTVPSDNR